MSAPALSAYKPSACGNHLRGLLFHRSEARTDMPANLNLIFAGQNHDFYDLYEQTIKCGHIISQGRSHGFIQKA